MEHYLAKVMAATSVVGGIGALLVAGTGQGQRPKKANDFVFSQSLEVVLATGVVKGDEHAKAACLACLFSDDAVLIETASNVLLTRHKLLGANVLSKALAMLRRSRSARDGILADQRLSVLLSFAFNLDDGWSYIDAAVLHLESKNGSAWARAIFPLGDAYPFLSEEARTRHIRLPYTAQELRKGTPRELTLRWREVLKAMGKKAVTAAMSRMFAKDRKAMEGLQPGRGTKGKPGRL